MTPKEIEATFERIAELQQLDIDHAIERGRNYLIERLQVCRQKTDEIGQIAVRVKRALLATKIARRNAGALLKLQKSNSAAEADKLAAENEYDELKTLEEAVNVCRSTLRAADSDIRLAGALLGVQIGLGQFRPEADKPIGAPLGETDPTTDEPEEPTTGIDLVGLITPEATIDPRDAAHVPTETPAADKPAGRGADTRPATTTTVVEDSDEIDLASLIA